MASYSRFMRLMSQSAAAAGLAAMLWIAAPALASESAVTGGAAAATRTTRSVTKYRARIAVSHFRRQLTAISGDPGCSGVWCGRQFVLMLGIGY